MVKPVCICDKKNGTVMKVKKNGVTVAIGAVCNDGSCLCQDADLYECPNCGMQILENFGEAYRSKIVEDSPFRINLEFYEE